MAQEIKTFEDFKINKQILQALEDMGYTEPTPIQKKAIPLLTAGHDLLGIAQTGTGKTAAYLIPLIMKVKYAQGDNPRALILTPTRELAMQVEENLKQLAKYTDLRSVCVYGGIGMKTQVEQVSKGIDILVATPGRFMDIYRSGNLILKEIRTFILDEADKMMDMGFHPQIRKVLEILPRKKQNVLCSATMPDKVVKLSEEFLEFPEIAEATPQATSAETVDQYLYQVPNFKTKINLLEHLLRDESLVRVIVFVKTRARAENLFKFISRRVRGKVRVIHANKGQNSRINAMEEFKGGEVRVLVTTDVTARGIDISLVSHVINFDVPLIYEDYVHRIGRTGRANHLGEAITFANEGEMLRVRKIEELIKKEISVLPIPDLIEIEKTEVSERQEIALEIDNFKKRENPDFKGAFHDKKEKQDRSRKRKR